MSIVLFLNFGWTLFVLVQADTGRNARVSAYNGTRIDVGYAITVVVGRDGCF